MKKLLIITSVLSLAALSAMSQGVVNALNGPSTSPIQVQNAAINGGVAKTVGSGSVNAGFTGTGPGSVQVSMWVFAAGTDLSNPRATLLLNGTPIAPTHTYTSSLSGLAGAQGSIAYPNGSGNPFVLPTSGTAFDGSAPVEFIFYGLIPGLYDGFTSVATLTPQLASSQNPNPPSIFGAGAGQINSFVLTSIAPEPSTIALGVLGAGALLAFRRRK